MPDFSLQLDSRAYLNTRDIPTGKPIVLFYFKSDCGYCQQETNDIVKKMDEFKGARFYFITLEDTKRAKAYSDYFKLANFENITVGTDTSQFFIKHFEPKGTPMLVVYDKYKRLRAVFGGALQVDSLIKWVKEV